MPAATRGMIDLEGPWRPLTSRRAAVTEAPYQSMNCGFTSKTVSPATRPIRPTTAPHNQETLDVEEQRQAAARQRSARKFGPHQHHRDQHWAAEHGVAGAQQSDDHGPTLEGLQDRGKAHKSFEANHGKFNPMTACWEVEPANFDEAEFALVPGTKKRSITREAACGPATCGKYDPILHQWVVPPNEKAWHERERQHQNEVGVRMEGHAMRPSGQGTYDPIRNEWLTPPLGSVEAAAGNRSRHEEHEWLAVKTARRMANTQHRTGVYDPLLNKWIVEPSEVERVDEQMRLKAHGDIPTKRQVPLPANMGVYDPIRNTWMQLPANPRIWGGQTFAPRC